MKFLLYSSKRDFLLIGACRRYKYKSKVNTGDTHTFTFLSQLIRSCWLFQGGWNFPWAVPWSGLLYLGFPGSPTHQKRGEIRVELERWKHQGKIRSSCSALHCVLFSSPLLNDPKFPLAQFKWEIATHSWNHPSLPPVLFIWHTHTQYSCRNCSFSWLAAFSSSAKSKTCYVSYNAERGSVVLYKQFSHYCILSHTIVLKHLSNMKLSSI